MSKIVVSLGETINTGNYSNLKLFVSIEKDVETETVEDKYAFLAETKALFDLANEAIEKQKEGTTDTTMFMENSKYSTVRGF
ncbi:MAG: hypothetical protein XD93_0612 [candidate division WS6 bacterium 34_10]|uniref:Uncharacterized protein n=1 Tax=candidate division WS6 bacterium 34_10 TaxID=1641389 RepID=A0A124FX57_9BACT|nr:MAG: hypothetical protein XD93_0612 [candidate division WS6 bacterium 34_10]